MEESTTLQKTATQPTRTTATNDPMEAYAQGLLELIKANSNICLLKEELKGFSYDSPQALAKDLRRYAKTLIENNQKYYKEIFFTKYIKKVLRFHYASFQNPHHKKAGLGTSIIYHPSLRSQLGDYESRSITTREYLHLTDKIGRWWKEEGFEIFMQDFKICGLELVPLLEELPITVFIYNTIHHDRIVINPISSDYFFTDLTSFNAFVPQKGFYINESYRNHDFIELSLKAEKPNTTIVGEIKKFEVSITSIPSDEWQLKSAFFCPFFPLSSTRRLSGHSRKQVWQFTI